MGQVSLRAYNPIEVDILGSQYESQDLPEAKAERSGAIFARLDAIAQDERDRELARMHGETVEPLSKEEDQALRDESRALTLDWFDLVLAPAEGGKKKASTVLKAGLSSGKVTPRQLTMLFQEIMLEVAKANRGPDPEEVAEAAIGSNGDRPT